MDVERLREETPGCRNRAHLDNAGAGLMPRSVLEAVRGHLELEAQIGGYQAARERKADIDAAYDAVARLIGARRDNIAFVQNSTVAFTQALSSIPFERGDTILTTRNDYVSNQVQYLSLAKRFGVRIERAPDLPEGGVDPEAMRERIRALRPRLVAATWVPTNSGLVQPVAEIGAACREAEVPFLLDACQALGQMPIDAAALGCDFLSATARKFLRGPRGVGFLYVSDRALAAGLEPLFPDLAGADWTGPDAYRAVPGAKRFETWEVAWALVLGTGAAAAYAMEVGIEPIRDRARALASRFRRAGGFVSRVRVLDRGRDLCAIATFTIPGETPDRIQAALKRRGVNFSLSTRAYAVLDMDDKGAAWAVRLSPHYYNTEEEIDLAVEAAAELP
jgi:selenocysteine lyase/cysteine desulfurase